MTTRPGVTSKDVLEERDAEWRAEESTTLSGDL